MDADVGSTNVGTISQKAKPTGILTGLFTGNPSGLMKGKVIECCNLEEMSKKMFYLKISHIISTIL